MMYEKGTLMFKENSPVSHVCDLAPYVADTVQVKLTQIMSQ